MEKLESDVGDKIELDAHDYWQITSDEWSDFNQQPLPAVGSLEDDIKMLQESLDDSALFTYTDFDRLAAVLKAISEKQAPIYPKTEGNESH